MKTKVKPQSHRDTEPGTDAGNGLPELKWVLTKSIQPDPEQPRKEFTQESLLELASSMHSPVGQVMPLLVEWVSEAKLREPDLVSREWRVEKGKQGGGFYKIIFGERRWRAAGITGKHQVDGQEVDFGKGLERLKVMVADTSAPNWEKQRLAIQLAENQHRENLSALEEAAAYLREIESGRHTKESLYQELGISRGSLFQRLALTRLAPFVREALVAGRISTSVAGLFPMIPKEEEQKKFLEQVGGTDWRSPRPFREAQDLLEAEFCQQLKGAPFKLDDAELVPAEWAAVAEGKELAKFQGPLPAVSLTPSLRAHTGNRVEDDGQGHKKTIWNVWSGEVGTMGGLCIADNVNKPTAQALADFINRGNAGLLRRLKGGACEDCPFRTKNLPEYPDQAKRPNVCTQPACYHQKVKAHWVKAAQGKIAQGETVLDATTYKRSKGEYVEASKEQWLGGGSQSWSALVGKGKQAPTPLLAVTEKGLIKVYKKEEAVAAAKKKGVKIDRDEAQTREQKAKEKEKRERDQRLAEARRKMVNGAAEELAPGLDKLSEKAVWTLLEEHADTYVQEVARGLLKKVKTPKARAVILTLGGDNLDPINYGGDWNKDVVALWKELGVDLMALDKELLKKDKEVEEKPGGGG